MADIQVFDPPMCCSSGVCGPAVDPVLPRFAADLQWLKSQGIQVQRYNLSQQPNVFVETEAVRRAVSSAGVDCLPLILVDGQVVSRGEYPMREQLAAYAELAGQPKITGTDGAAEDCCDGSARGCCGPDISLHFISGKKGC